MIETSLPRDLIASPCKTKKQIISQITSDLPKKQFATLTVTIRWFLRGEPDLLSDKRDLYILPSIYPSTVGSPRGPFGCPAACIPTMQLVKAAR